MTQSNFSPEDSIRLIEDMIQKTRSDYSHQSRFFLLWGWATLAACLGQFALKVWFDYDRHYLVWLITIPCAIFTMIIAARQGRQVKVVTYVNENMRTLWMGVGISFFILSMIFIKLGWLNCFPFYMMLYGLGSFVSGNILKFRPLIIGGMISWILAMLSVWVRFDYQALMAGAAILFSYIIPGHMIRATGNPHA